MVKTRAESRAAKKICRFVQWESMCSPVTLNVSEDFEKLRPVLESSGVNTLFMLTLAKLAFLQTKLYKM